MDTSRRKELKKRYLEEHRKNDFAFQYWASRQEQISQAGEITKAVLEQCPNDYLENKLVDHVLNQFSRAGKRPKHQHVQEWERTILLQLPLGIQAIYATYLFESALSLSGGFWDFFYQNNGAFTLEVLSGYWLMENREMVHIVEQCMGAYLKMKRSGEIEELMGEPHHWNIDETYYLSIHKKNFAQLDAEYQLNRYIFLTELKSYKIRFIRNNPLLFTSGK